MHTSTSQAMLHTFRSPLLAQMAAIAGKYSMRAELDDDGGGDDGDDPSSSFVERMAAKYDAEDSKTLQDEDGPDDEGNDDHDDADDSDDEHADSDTSDDDPDGDDDESDEDSTDDDDADHTDDDESEESDDDDTAGDDDDEDEDDDEVSGETKALLAKAGADLTLSDVPKEYRGLIEKKLRSVDSAFTRYAKEATAFRADRAQFEAEQVFRKDHPEMFVAEMILNDETLFEKINKQLEEIADPLQAKAFKIVVEDTRKKAATAIEAKRTADERFESRGSEMHTLAMKLAAEAGLPARMADLAVGSALMQLPKDKRDLSDADIARIIAAEAKEHMRTNRAARRDKSKEKVKTRTAVKKNAAPAAKRGATIGSPRPGKQKPHRVDMNSEDARQAAFLRSTKRIMPGVK